MDETCGRSGSDSAPDPTHQELDQMLIFGDPETRRKFLKRIAGTSAALTIGPSLFKSAQGQTLPASPAAIAGPASVPGAIKINLSINGQTHGLQVDPRVSLLDALREHLDLTGSKKGCDHGQCGACTVLVNGRRINSCLSLAVMHEGDEITTIEGLSRGDELHPMQAAFVEH